ncbi:tetratricopeptide repeat protein [Salidesulfovibrio brasiliensis]|uniref:tetratricopeptide repeat protein n=1 Tax=Salidesulfovibrio brasiliensis TaxID=221711 RepID=UPI0006D15309|nr:tetratricopeptide repeat protein [Salidesulfovibrio brasiliensis]
MSADQQGTKQPSQPVAGLGDNRISGVFSTQSVVKVGTGTTQRKTIQKTYWFCEEREDGGIDVQPLNKHYVPSGPKRDVPREEFLEKFSPEPEFYVQTVYPAMQELNDTIVRGEKHRARGAQYSAEFEFKQATNIDEENVRANFGLGLTYLDRGDQAKANDIFKRLVKLDATFETEHKHLFNDFGINLRKNRMYDQALDYYLRAEGLADNRDEHLFHNIARVFYEQGDLEKCAEYLKKSLELNPNLEESKKFWEFLENNGQMGRLGQKSDKRGGKRKVEIDL